MADSSPYVDLIENFGPGYHDGAAPNRLPGGATPDARNGWFHEVQLGESGAVERVTMGRRPGSRLLHPTAMALGAKVDGLFEFRRIGQDAQLLGVCAGKLYLLDDVDPPLELTPVAIWTPGRAVTATIFRSNLVLSDGTVSKRWNGTDLLELSTAAPTSAPGLAAVAGPGVTGTYRGFAVWYDPVMEHESSPSEVTAPVVFADETRRWTQPTGAPGAEYSQWRVYCQRTDTNELNFYRCATTPIGTATVDETTSDTARREAGPAENDNDPPPALALLTEWKGYGIGLEADSDEYVVSKKGDLQSWHPRHRFPVGRGGGEALTTAKVYGEECVLQKPASSWRLSGDVVPFNLRPIRGSYGNVSPLASIEVDDLYYAWDRDKGPYVTDTVAWRDLSRGRLKAILKTVTRTALAQIRVGHSEEHRIIFWAVPVNGGSRPSVILPYQYELGTWLPPMTGLEWASFAGWSNPSTTQRAVYAGDQWGRVFELFVGQVEGVPLAAPFPTLTGAVTAATTDTLTDATASFYTTGDGLVGLPVAVRGSDGSWQWRRIASNTSTVLTLDIVHGAPFSIAPAVGDAYIVCGLEWYWWTPIRDDFDPFAEKQQFHLYVDARASSVDAELDVRMRVNSALAAEVLQPFAFEAGGAVWGEAVWGVDLWGATTQGLPKRDVGQTVRAVQYRLACFTPNVSVVVSAIARTSDAQPRRRGASA